MASSSLTENRGVGGSTPPLAINTCKSGCFPTPPRSGRPFLGIMVLPVRGTCGQRRAGSWIPSQAPETPAPDRPIQAGLAQMCLLLLLLLLARNRSAASQAVKGSARQRPGERNRMEPGPLDRAAGHLFAEDPPCCASGPDV